MFTPGHHSSSNPFCGIGVAVGGHKGLPSTTCDGSASGLKIQSGLSSAKEEANKTA